MKKKLNSKKLKNLVNNRFGSMLYALCLLCVIASCSAEAQVEIQNDYSGSLELDLRVSDILLQYYQDITGDYEAEHVYNIPQIMYQIYERPGLRLRNIEATDENILKLVVEFDDINTVFQNELGEFEDESIVSIRQTNDDRTRLTVHVSSNLIRSILALGFVQNSAVASYLLPSGTGSSREYRDDLVWALEEYADSAQLNELIDDSILRVSIVVPAEPEAFSEGGVLASGSGDSHVVTFSLAILDLLTIEDEQELFILYR